MSLVPYRDARRSRRRPLDRDQIVRAALALLDEAGLDELTMRRLADRLGVQAASLYRHVRDKRELLVLLADEVTGEIPLVSPEGPWRARLVEMGHAVRRGLLARRDAARLLAETAPVGPRRLRHIENLLALLRAAGLSGRDAARVSYHLNNYVTGFAEDEARWAAAAAGVGSRKKMLGDARRYFQSLPPAEFPHVVELAGHLAEDDADAQFEQGMQVWLREIERLAGARAR